MIEAHQYRWAAPLLDTYNAFILRKAFARIRVANLATLASSGAAVVAANHSCWWDGAADLHLTRRVLRRQSLLMMGEDELSKYKVFSSLGVFSVPMRGNAQAFLPSIRYAIAQLRRGDAPLLWIYPQGEMLPARTALRVRPGALVIASAAEVPVIPVAQRYEFLRDDHPEVIVRVGQPLVNVRRDDASRLEEAMRALLAQVDDDIASNTLGEYQEVFSGTRTRSDELQRLRRATQ